MLDRLSKCRCSLNCRKLGCTGKFLLDPDNTDYLSIFDEFSNGVIVTDSKGVIVYCNQGQYYQNSQSPWNLKAASVLQNQEI